MSIHFKEGLLPTRAAEVEVPSGKCGRSQKIPEKRKSAQCRIGGPPMPNAHSSDALNFSAHDEWLRFRNHSPSHYSRLIAVRARLIPSTKCSARRCAAGAALGEQAT